MNPIDRIREALAAGPTPGPWIDEGYGWLAHKGDVICQFWGKTEEDWDNHEANKSFIASCSPDAITTLLRGADAWKAYAQHQEYCQCCAESVEICHEGRELRAAAMKEGVRNE